MPPPLLKKKNAPNPPPHLQKYQNEGEQDVDGRVAA
jgi:hypothetical protein